MPVKNRGPFPHADEMASRKELPWNRHDVSDVVDQSDISELVQILQGELLVFSDVQLYWMEDGLDRMDGILKCLNTTGLCGHISKEHAKYFRGYKRDPRVLVNQLELNMD